MSEKNTTGAKFFWTDWDTFTPHVLVMNEADTVEAKARAAFDAEARSLTFAKDNTDHFQSLCLTDKASGKRVCYMPLRTSQGWTVAKVLGTIKDKRTTFPIPAFDCDYSLSKARRLARDYSNIITDMVQALPPSTPDV